MVALGKALLLLALLVGFLRLTSILAEQGRFSTEVLRKSIHIGLGLVCLGLPWLFDGPSGVVLLLIGVMGLFVGIRLNPVLGSRLGAGLHGVERDSLGDVFFAISVFLLFLYARHNPALYLLPLLTLALSDAGAALVGVHLGKHRFSVPSGVKSWEGTLFFCMLTVLLGIVILSALTSLALPAIICIALLLGIVGCMVEAASWHGFDNLLVPMGLYLLLNGLMQRTFPVLALTLIVVCAALFFMSRTARFSSLTTHAFIGAIVAAFFFHEAGGPLWLAAAAVVFIAHILLSAIQKDADEVGINAVVSVLSCGIVWLAAENLWQFNHAYYLFLLSLAVHVQIIILLRIRQFRDKGAEYPLVLSVSLLSAWAFFPLQLLAYPGDKGNPALFAGSVVILTLGGVLTTMRSQGNEPSRWREQALYALSGSLAGLVFVWVTR